MFAEKHEKWNFHNYRVVKMRNYRRNAGLGRVPRTLALLMVIVMPYIWLCQHILSTNQLSQVFLVLHTENDIGPYFRGLNISGREFELPYYLFRVINYQPGTYTPFLLICYKTSCRFEVERPAVSPTTQDVQKTWPDGRPSACFGRPPHPLRRQTPNIVL